MKLKCIKCNAIATWYYMPDDDNDCYCDNCVPRGCSCNSVIDEDCNPILGEDGYFIEKTDNQGRLYPCCEYGFSEEGIDNES